MLLYRHRLTAIVMLVACAHQTGSGQTFSSGISGDYRITRDVTYLTRDGWEGKLDVYARANTSAAQPTLIFFHGGNPDRGGRETVVLNLLAYLEWGWHVVNVEHRQIGVTLAPAAIQNSVCALNWVVQNAQTFGFDVNRIVVSGTSSGGWFALTTAMANNTKSPGLPCSEMTNAKVAAVVNWFGVTDLVDVVQGPNTKTYGPLWVRGLSEPLAVAKSVSPLTLIRPSVPPVISIHGDADPTVPYSHGVRLHEQLKKMKVLEELVTIPGGAHGGFSRPQNERAFQRIKAFLATLGIAARE